MSNRNNRKPSHRKLTNQIRRDANLRAFADSFFKAVDKSLFPKGSTKAPRNFGTTRNPAPVSQTRSQAAKQAWKTMRANTPKATLTKRFKAAARKAAQTRQANRNNY